MTSVADQVAAQALLARLAKGVEHRLNNLITVLLISAQQVEEMGDDPDEIAEVRAALGQIVDKLGLLQEVLCSRSKQSDVARVAASVASVVNGLDHRVTIDVDASGTATVAVATHELARTLIAAYLVAQAALAGAGGKITIRCLARESTVDLELRARANQELKQIDALDDQARADLRLFTELAADAESTPRSPAAHTSCASR
ncbi:MAG: hypothetical protein KJO07_16200 [Deltaproteobacteria bacterium]|nr:hypothetical protein [Deltaproteobacteria bacterium]